MLVIPISSAQCEHGFSAQKRVKSPWIHKQKDLIRISMEGPELAAFDPTPVVENWLNSGRDQGGLMWFTKTRPEKLVPVCADLDSLDFK